MKLSEKQIEFAEFMIQNIVQAVSPVIKKYIDESINTAKKQVLAEVKKMGAVPSDVNWKRKSEKIRENTQNIASSLFFNDDGSKFVDPLNVAFGGGDSDLNQALTEMKRLSPKVDSNILGLDLSSGKPTEYSNVSLDTKLGLDFTIPDVVVENVTIESIQDKAQRVNEAIINGNHNPIRNIMSELENKDYSKFIE